jgi:RNA polymerase primary sigma factor
MDMGNKFDDMELPQEILDELEADAAAAEEAEVQEDDGMQTEDIYRVYMEELAAIPPCTAAENEELLGKVKAGVAGARERLIEGYLRNALMYVQNYINRGVPMADLIQEASMELMMLVDDAFEGSFEKLLESRIRVRMEEVISEQTSASNIEEEVLARVNVLQEVSKELAERFGREPKLEELAEYMKMTEDEVREIMKVTMDALSLSEANRALQS